MQPFSFHSSTLPPPFGESIFLENIHEYSLSLGISRVQAEEVILHSQNPDDIALGRHTGDRRRFSDIDKLMKWYDTPGRYTFTLTNTKGEIAGLWWGRPGVIPTISDFISSDMQILLESQQHNIHTSGIRIYPFARSQGLAGLLLTQASSYYRVVYPRACICVDVNQENIPSQKLFVKQGYILIGYGENKKTIISTPSSRLVYVEIPTQKSED